MGVIANAEQLRIGQKTLDESDRIGDEVRRMGSGLRDICRDFLALQHTAEDAEDLQVFQQRFNAAVGDVKAVVEQFSPEQRQLAAVFIQGIGLTQ